MSKLTIAEALFLLSRRNETGASIGTHTNYALIGGGLAELMLMGRLKPDADKPKRLNLVDNSPTGDAFLDELLAAIAKKGSGKPAQSYVTGLVSKSNLRETLANGLVERGILERVEKSFLAFSWSNYPEKDGSVEKALCAHLAAIMFADEVPEARDCVVIALAHKTGLLRSNFDKFELNANKKRVKQIAAGELELTRPATDAIAAVQMVVLMAAIMPAIAASSVS